MNNTFSLKEIAEKTNCEITIDIPALQRGLVWKAKQVEFLWDSILRGFPIGGFILSENNGNHYDLMDGQQRFNAIGLGFEEPEKNAKSILWIDIDFNQKDEQKSTRKFFVKATTTAHPWGYNNDDECKLLSAKERKDALKEFGFSEGTNIYKTLINLLETYPYKSKFPIPLAYILTSIDKNKEVFVPNVISKCKNSNCQTWGAKFWNNENKTKLEKWLDSNFETLLSLVDYKLPFSLLPKNTIDNEDQIENTNESSQTDLEVLFQRLNTGGTQISRDDLMYSAIKAYWGSIKDKNEELAKGLMSPQNLIQILFRLILTEINDADRFEATLSIKKIRELSKDVKKKDAIEKFFNSESTKNIKRKMLALTENTDYAIPKYVLMKIVKEKPDVIQLALYLIKNKKIEDEKLVGLILYLYWFSINTNEVINRLYQKCKNSTDVLNDIKEEIADLTYEKNLQNVYTPEEICKLKTSADLRDSISNRPEGKFIMPLLWYPQTNSMAKTFLLYAQRKFLMDNFSIFNPADTVSWEDHNCPWDYDHIFPQNKINTFRKSDYKDSAKFWLWSIGNFAAIPFEENRSKSDEAEYKFYENKTNKEALLYSSEFENVVQNNCDEHTRSKLFADIVFTRMVSLYERCFAVFQDFVPCVSNSKKSEQRREIMESLQKKIEEKCTDCKTDFYFVREGNDLREYKLENPRDWFRFCISLKANLPKFDNSDCMISFTWNHLNGDSLEFGIRGVNSTAEKRTILEKNNRFSQLDLLIQGKAFINKTAWSENEWWYRGCYVNIKPEQLNEVLEPLADLYVNLYKEFSK